MKEIILAGVQLILGQGATTKNKIGRFDSIYS